MSTQITQQQPPQAPALTTKSLFGRDDVKKKFQEMLGKKAQGFITSVLQIVAQNTMLVTADPNSVLQSAAVAATLDLPLNNNLGFAYIVPYKEKVKGKNGQPDTYRTVAQFQMGYKGFIQLAQRSGQFKTISSTPVYDGQLVDENPLTGFEFDWNAKKSDTVIGYAAYFKLLNGFEKIMYMTVADLNKHGLRYSKTFDHSSGLWKKDFDAMASKTVLKLLISKFGPMSIELQKAVITDQSVVKDAETNDVDYVDATEETVYDDLSHEKAEEKAAEIAQKKEELRNAQQGTIQLP